MPDSFTNARAYFDPTFPSSGDGYSIASHRNTLAGLGFLDHLPLQPRAHNPANRAILVRGRDSAGFYNPVYYGNADQRTPFVSGDTANFATPASNPRIDIVYMTPSGDYKIAQGTEAASPALPSLSPSGDSRFPICAVWNRPGQTKIVNFEDKGANTGDGYIYQDLRPWMRTAGAGSASLGSTNPVSPTGDAQASPGVLATAARSDHVHGGVHGVRLVGSSLIQGDVEFSGPGGALSQAGNRITVNGIVVQQVQFSTNIPATGSTATPYDNTTPQSNEGDQYMSLSITPKNALNWLKIEVIFQGTNNSAVDMAVCLFQDANANALNTAHTLDAGGGVVRPIPLVHWILAGTTSSTTFKIRAGGSVSSVFFNRDAAVLVYNNTMTSSITITEYATP